MLLINLFFTMQMKDNKMWEINQIKDTDLRNPIQV